MNAVKIGHKDGAGISLAASPLANSLAGENKMTPSLQKITSSEIPPATQANFVAKTLIEIWGLFQISKKKACHN